MRISDWSSDVCSSDLWEVSLVNEMLTQMEGHDGIFIASTNQIDALDKAALRRFDIKIGFGALRPNKAWELLRRQCAVLGIGEPEAELEQYMGRLNGLVPGDFATVARRKIGRASCREGGCQYE